MVNIVFLSILTRVFLGIPVYIATMYLSGIEEPLTGE